MRRGTKKLIAAALVLLIVTGGLLMRFTEERWVAAAEAVALQNTTEQLDNPDRGFYLIHGVLLSDDMDPQSAVEERFSQDSGRSLALLEISLANYSDKEISEAGLGNLRGIFDAVRDTGMHFIVRFLYDWDGRNMEKEPVRRGIVQRHIEQVAPIINDNADQIYTLQGLFVGNWGEMNGTRYTGSENWRALAASLAEATDPSVYLSVRMPMQWRCICGESESDAAAEGVRGRMGLFNDGMLGSRTDLGTYSDTAAGTPEYTDAWARADELAFQEELCRSVPNGGEVVSGDEGYTLDEAIDYLRTAHISYLNEDYDRRVLDSWADGTVSGGAWDGRDGLSYIRAHLGYRFTASDATVRYSFLRNTLTVTVDIKNEGFAPAYFEVRPVLVVLQDGRECLSVPFSGDLSSLGGGNDTESCTLRAEVPVSEIGRGDCSLALRLESGRGRVLTANEGRAPSGELIIGGIREK